MDHDGVILRSDDELSEITCNGTSAILFYFGAISLQLRGSFFRRELVDYQKPNGTHQEKNQAN